MNKIKIAFLLLLIVNIVACTTKYKELDNNTIKKAFILNSSPTFKGYYYQGSDSKFHFFRSKWQLQKDHYFKIEKTQLKVNNPFEVNTKELRVDLFITDTNFGSNKFCTLYTVE